MFQNSIRNYIETNAKIENLSKGIEVIDIKKELNGNEEMKKV